MPRHTLTPEDGRKGALARNANALAVQQANYQRAVVVNAVVDEVGDLSPAALSAAMSAIARAADVADDVELADALDWKRFVEGAEILHRIHRLASGQSTSNSAHATLTDEERRERMARLRGDTTSPPTE